MLQPVAMKRRKSLRIKKPRSRALQKVGSTSDSDECLCNEDENSSGLLFKAKGSSTFRRFSSIAVKENCNSQGQEGEDQSRRLRRKKHSPRLGVFKRFGSTAPRNLKVCL